VKPTRTIPNVEYRTTGTTNITAEGDGLSGLACPFNSPTQIGAPEWGFREEFTPGAFTKTLSERDVVVLVNHNTDMPVARKSAGTLRTSQTAKGLEWDADPVDTSYVNDLRANIKAKNFKGCSFGFEAVKEDWFDDDGNRADPSTGTQRVVREAKLHEISVVTFPAYGDTEVSTRSAVNAIRELRAAKASYKDLDTCAECGAENQYGAFCSGCGAAMTEPKPQAKFCTQCGSKITGKRDAHLCTEIRGKYTADDKKSLLAKGHAIKNAKGDPSYPVDDEEDLKNAIQAVGRGGTDHDSIRKYVAGRAKAMGLSSLIPDNWNSDGSLKEQNSAVSAAENRTDGVGDENAAADNSLPINDVLLLGVYEHFGRKINSDN
jgi:HK97 family phage prohead protease